MGRRADFWRCPNGIFLGFVESSLLRIEPTNRSRRPDSRFELGPLVTPPDMDAGEGASRYTAVEDESGRGGGNPVCEGPRVDVFLDALFESSVMGFETCLEL
mmetsp:Transcript_9817/g.26167  ORF Transcript_9817/g.26167 Transcript_9817/m.26167 type:complete len:102 (-) Transcript_9817:1608-1913(-)